MGILILSLRQNRSFFTHPKRILFFLICSVVLTTYVAVEMKDVFATEGINETINFQGRVANTDGTNVADGNYDFIFRLYKAGSGGSAQWTETWNSGTSQVTVTNGIFRVALGTHQSLSSLDFNDDSWYLSVEFDGDGEMDPRIRFASVPYALNAKKVAGLTVTDTTGTFTLADGKTFVVNNGLTFSGTDSTTFTFPSAGGNIVTEDFTQTLTNKTLTEPRFADLGFIADSNGNELLILDSNASAVNEITISNGATGVGPTIIASGETNVPLTINSKAAGAITIDSGTTGIVNIGTGNNAKTLNLGTGNAGNTINIGTNNTVSDTITIGSLLDDVSITGDDWSITAAGALTVVSCSGCGGSQTPWTSDIDADGFDLIDLSNILFRETTGSPAGTDVGLFRDNSGDLNLNVLSSKSFNVQVNGTDEYGFSSTALSLGANNLSLTSGNILFSGSGNIQFSQNITSGTGVDFLNVGTSGVGIDFTSDTITHLTTGSLIKADLTTSGSGVGTNFTGDLINLSLNRRNVSVVAVTDTGNLLDLSRSIEADSGSGGSFTINGDVATLSSTCDNSSGTCTDTSNILSLSQGYTSATGAVLEIENDGAGNAIDILGSGTRAINSTTGNLSLLTTTSGDIILNSAGNIVFSDFTNNNNSVLFTGASGALSVAETTSSDFCLVSNGASASPAWESCPGGSGGSSNWVLNSSDGTLSPINNTLDFLWGGTATDSADFAVLNTAGSGPATASVSGNLIVMPNNGAGGNVGIGTINPSDMLTLQGGNFTHKAYGDPKPLSNIATASDTFDVEVVGKYAYMADGAAGLRVIDVSNPSLPVALGTYDSTLAYGVAVSGKYAYLADDSSGLIIVDVSNPNTPTFVGQWDNPSGNSFGVAVSGNYAYLADGSAGLRIINISNPSEPFLVGTLDTADSSEEVAVQGDYAYIADGTSGLYVIDVSNPYAPTTTDTYNPAGSGNSDGIYVSGKYAYLGDQNTGLSIVNVSNPSDITLTATISPDNSMYGSFVAGNYIYITDGTAGVQVYDISNPASPVKVGTYNSPTFAWSITVSGKYAYVADSTGGLRILDINGIATPSISTGSLSANAINISENLSVAGSGNFTTGIAVGNGGILSNGALSVYSGNGTFNSIQGASSGNALFILNQMSTQDIFAASSSGIHVFKVTQDGSIESTGHMALGSSAPLSSANLLNLIETYSGTSDFTGINSQITKSTAVGEFYAIVANPAYTGSGNNSANNFIGINSVPFYAGSGNMVNSIGIYSQAVSMQTGSSGIVGSAYGLYVGNPSVIGGTGTITDNIGIYVAPMTTGGTSDVGVAIDAAETQTLWLDAHGLGTTSDAGIAFGSARDTMLYRSASNTLATGNIELSRSIFPSVSSFDSSIDYISTYILGDITTSARGDVRFIIDSNNNSTGTFRILANGNTTEVININESGNILGAANSVYDTLASGTLGIGTTTATTITIGRSTQTINLAGYTNGGSGCGTLGTNSSGVITCGGSASQTPWTSNIDGDNYSLLDMGTNITARNGLTLGTGSNGNLTLTPNGTGDIMVSGDGDTNLQINFSAPPTDNMVEISNSGQGTTTNGASGLYIDITQGDDGDSTDLNAGLMIDATSSSGDADGLMGVMIGSITGGSALEIGLVIGEGWDAGLIISSGGATNSGLVYEGEGRPTKTITLSPEYAGAVLTDYYGAGTDSNITGAMTSDTDTTQGTSIRNYYQWERTTDATQHFYTVAVRVTLPADFSAWATSNAVVVNYITESATNTVSDLDVRVYNENSATIVASSTNNASTSWSTVAVDDSTLDDDTDSEWDEPAETAVIYLRMGSASSNFVRIGDIELNYLASF